MIPPYSIFGMMEPYHAGGQSTFGQSYPSGPFSSPVLATGLGDMSTRSRHAQTFLGPALHTPINSNN